MGSGSDANFAAAVRQRHCKHRFFHAPRREQSSFGIVHYAGTVVYDARGFLMKNKDLLLPNVYGMLTGSRCERTAALFPRLSADDRKKYSLGKKFRMQLQPE